MTHCCFIVLRNRDRLFWGLLGDSGNQLKVGNILSRNYVSQREKAVLVKFHQILGKYQLIMGTFAPKKMGMILNNCCINNMDTLYVGSVV